MRDNKPPSPRDPPRMATLIFCRDAGPAIEILVNQAVHKISPEKALDLATELLKLAGPKLKARAYGTIRTGGPALAPRDGY